MYQILNLVINFYFIINVVSRSSQDENGRGYNWGKEKFTRLQLQVGTHVEASKPENASDFEWRILHQPFRATYADPSNYRSIAAPILQDDWKFSSGEFKIKSATVETIQKCEFIDKCEYKGSPRKAYSVLISIRASDFWSPECSCRIGGLTLTVTVTVQQIETAFLRKNRKKLNI